jgi:hypothetical protein
MTSYLRGRRRDSLRADDGRYNDFHEGRLNTVPSKICPLTAQQSQCSPCSWLGSDTVYLYLLKYTTRMKAPTHRAARKLICFHCYFIAVFHGRTGRITFISIRNTKKVKVTTLFSRESVATIEVEAIERPHKVNEVCPERLRAEA